MAADRPLESYRVLFNEHLAEWEASVLQFVDASTEEVLMAVSVEDDTNLKIFHCARPFQIEVGILRRFLDYSDEKQ